MDEHGSEEEPGEVQNESYRGQGRVLLLTMCAAGIGGTFQYGYNLTIINAPTMHIQKFVNETWLERSGQQLDSQVITLIWSIIVSVYPLGGFLGALLAGPMAIRLGRKKSLLVNNLFVILSAILCGFSRSAKSFEMIVLGRILAGLNSGVSMNVQPMYLAESAPKKLRGTVAMSSAVFTALGLVLGQVIGLSEILGSEDCWPFLLASNAIPAILQLFVLPWLPESPRYLLIDLKDKDSCICGGLYAVLQKYRFTAVKLFLNSFIYMFALLFQQGLGHFCFIPFLVACVSTSLYVGLFLPETKGKSLLEITEEFTKHSVKRKNVANGWSGPQEIKSTML